MDCNTVNIIFQIIGAIGSLATFGAFVFLFRRDKDKQTQIDKLAGITTILESQNEMMKMQNDLIAQQVDIFRNTGILKGNDEGALTQLREIEEKKLRLSVKPNLWSNGAGYSGYDCELKIDLNNKGEDAKLLAFNLLAETFTMKEVQQLYEAIFDKPFARNNFQKKILDLNVLERLEKKFTGAANKAPFLYSFEEKSSTYK